MKAIFRTLLFSAIAIYLTTLWNKGFIVSLEPISFFKVTLLIAFITYLIIPISKIVLLPLNLLTFGLLSIILYMFILYLADNQLSLITIKAWEVQKISLLGLTIQKTLISYIGNLALISASLSAIIKAFEKVT